MSRGWRRLLTLVAGLLGVWAALIGVQRLFNRDPEVSSPVDLTVPNDAAAGEQPDFYVSDPGLLVKTSYEIKQRLTDKSGAALYWTAYFLRLDDGRFVFGHTDQEGNTRPVFVTKPTGTEYSVGDDAVANWERAMAEGSPEKDAGRGR